MPYSNNQWIHFADAFKERTEKIVVDNIKLFRSLPKTEQAKIIGRQLLRSSSSIRANYEAACRARSKTEFYSKLSIVVEEADESAYCLEILAEAQIVPYEQLIHLADEANQILCMASASSKTVSQKNNPFNFHFNNSTFNNPIILKSIIQ